MSASNWSICPICWQKEQDHLADLRRRLADDYGKIPLTEYEELRREVDLPRPSLKATFREDYEVIPPDRHGEGLDMSMVVEILYGGSCTVCSARVPAFSVELPVERE